MSKKIHKKDIERFEKAVRKLQGVLKDINKYNPDAHIFIADGGTFCLYAKPVSECTSDGCMLSWEAETYVSSVDCLIDVGAW